MIQSQPGSLVRFEIAETTRPSPKRRLSDRELMRLEFLWPSRTHGNPHLSTLQHE
jgi:hypothetical protein